MSRTARIIGCVAIIGLALLAGFGPIDLSEPVLAHENETSDYRYQDSFEDEAADSGMPHAWDRESDTGPDWSAAVNSGTASDGSQSMYLNTTDTLTLKPSSQPFDTYRTSDAEIAFNVGAGEMQLNLQNGQTDIAQVRVDQSTVYYKDDSGWNEHTSASGWVNVRIYGFDNSSETYNIEAGGATQTGISMPDTDSAPGYSETVVQSNSGTSGYVDNLRINNNNYLTGRVVDTDGNPCANCVVKSWGYNYNNFSGTKSEVESKIENLRNELNNLRPTNFSTSKSIPGDFEDSSTYVAAHTKADWTVQGHNIRGDRIPFKRLGEADLSSPRIQVDAGKTVILTTWDTTETGAFGVETLQAPANQELPGATVEEKIRIETLDPTGDIVATSTLDPVPIGESGINPQLHHGVVLDLSPGFYRIAPANNPSAGYVIAVGDPENIAGQYETELQNEIGGLTDYQQRLNDFVDQGKLTPQTTTTDENGNFNFSFHSATLSQTSLTGHSVPPPLRPIDPQNPPTKSEIRGYYENLSVESLQTAPSYYAPDATRSPTTSVPASHVTVGVREVGVPDYTSVNQSLERLRSLSEEIFGTSWGNLTAAQQQFLSDDRQELLNIYNETVKSASNEMRVRALDYLGNETSIDLTETEAYPDDPTTLTKTELKARIAALDWAKSTTPETLPSNPGNSTDEAAEEVERIIRRGLESVSSTFTLAGDVSKDNVSAWAVWGNGTRTPVADEYLTVSSSPTSIIPGVGSTTVQITDYPVDSSDPNTISFEVDALSADGRFGRIDTPAVPNPTFNGDIPAIQAIRLSTLEPATGQQFTARVLPAEQSSYESVSNVTLTGPDGTTVPATLTDDSTVTATPSQAGIHELEVTVKDDDGNEFVEDLPVPVRANDIPRPPTVRAQTTQFGTVALVGDGFRGGSVDTSATGSRVTLSGTVDEDLSERPHFYANSLATARKTTIEAQVLKGEDRQAYRETVGVAIHTRPIEGDVGDDVLVYRRTDGGALQPIQRDGSAYGAINSTGDGAVIETYGEGGAAVVVNRDPGFLEDAGWFIRTSVPFGTDILSLSLAIDPAGGLVGGIALGFLLPVVPYVVVRKRGGNS